MDKQYPDTTVLSQLDLALHDLLVENEAIVLLLYLFNLPTLRLLEMASSSNGLLSTVIVLQLSSLLVLLLILVLVISKKYLT